MQTLNIYNLKWGLKKKEGVIFLIDWGTPMHTMFKLKFYFFVSFICLQRSLSLNCINLQRERTTLNLGLSLATKKMSNSPWLLNFAAVYSYFNVQLCSYFNVENRILYFFKKWVFAFLNDGTFQGGESISPKFWEGGSS